MKYAVIIIIALLLIIAVAVVFNTLAANATRKAEAEALRNRTYRPGDPFSTADDDAVRGDPRQLKPADLVDFIARYAAGDRGKRKETDRFKRFDVADLLKRDKLNLDIFWLKDDSLDDVDSLPAPDVIAAEIVENLQAALEAFQTVADELAATPRAA